MKTNLLCLALLWLPALGQSEPAAPPVVTNNAPKTYSVRGVVQSVAPDLRHASIKHEAIPGYMAAMTMDFSARDTNALRGLSPGDQITFTLAVTETDDWIEHVQFIVKTNVFGLAGPPGWHIAAPELTPGDALPDYEFTDENGQTVHFSDFRGRAVAFTFFFTSCPLPEYCPRMSRHFSEARKILSNETNTLTNFQLLSISFDPNFDTPQMLSGYGKYYRSDDTNRWLFTVASAKTLASLAPKIDLNFWREGGSISHNLRTVVLDTGGKIFKQFDGNDWTPQELADALRQAANPPGH